MIGASQPKRLLVLCTTTGYQTCAFIEAAQKLGLSITFGTDRCHCLLYTSHQLLMVHQAVADMLRELTIEDCYNLCS